MNIESIEAVTRILQASISPVALISGVGLLILSQTNRFTRIADRLREMVRHRENGEPANEVTENQIRIFHQRAGILRSAISFSVSSVLLASVLVLYLFAIALTGKGPHLLVVVFFALSLVCLIISLALFLVDMHLSLKAIHEQLRGSLNETIRE